MAIKKWKVIVPVTIAAIVLFVMFWWSMYDPLFLPPDYPTYFAYTSDDMDALREVNSDKRMSVDDLF